MSNSVNHDRSIEAVPEHSLGKNEFPEARKAPQSGMAGVPVSLRASPKQSADL